MPNENRSSAFISFSTLALMLYAAAALPGCTMVGPDYAAPPLQTAAQWLEVDNTRIKADTVELKDWWRVFSDPVLDSLIQTAYEQNLPLRIAGVRVLEARARLAIAIGEFYPQQQQAFGALTYTRLSENEVAAASGDFDIREAQLGARASWEFDFWGRFRRAIQAQDANLLASMASYDDVLVSLLGDVADTYVIIRVLEQQLLIARANAKIQQETLNIANARFNAGQTGERDVQQALTQLRSTEATIPQLELSLEQSKNALAILLGMTPSEIRSRLAGPAVIPAAPSTAAVGIPADLLRRRPDIRFAEYQAIAQSAQIGVTQAELYPAFSLTGSFGLIAADTHGSDLGDFFSSSSRTATIGPTFAWNILNYGQIRNAVRLEDAIFQETLVNYQNTVLLAQREVEDGLASFIKSQEAVVFLSQAAEAARKTVALARIQYEGGATDYTTVINAQAALLQQENSLAQARGDVPQGLISVYRALGGGWEIRAGKEFVPASTQEEMQKRTDWGTLLAPAALEGGDVEKQPLRKPVW